MDMCFNGMISTNGSWSQNGLPRYISRQNESHIHSGTQFGNNFVPAAVEWRALRTRTEQHVRALRKQGRTFPNSLSEATAQLPVTTAALEVYFYKYHHTPYLKELCLKHEPYQVYTAMTDSTKLGCLLTDLLLVVAAVHEGVK